jgi:hypothetical protein
MKNSLHAPLVLHFSPRKMSHTITPPLHTEIKCSLLNQRKCRANFTVRRITWYVTFICNFNFLWQSTTIITTVPYQTKGPYQISLKKTQNFGGPTLYTDRWYNLEPQIYEDWNSFFFLFFFFFFFFRARQHIAPDALQPQAYCVKVWKLFVEITSSRPTI